MNDEFTLGRTAALLTVSRSELLSLLDSGALTLIQRGRIQRIRGSDLLNYRRRRTTTRKAALTVLLREAEESGLYDEDYAVTA